MFKRIVTSVLGVTLISGSALSLVGCERKAFDTRYWIMTDGGYVTDHAYHENVYDGLNLFVADVDGGNKVGSYLEPRTASSSDFLSGFKMLNTFKSQITVLSGYRFLPFEKEASHYLKKIVQVDGSIPQQFDNVVYIVFSAEISSFFAAIADAAYFSALVPEKIVNIPYLSTYGGLPNALSVTPYMWGFLEGMSFWNYMVSHKTSDVDPKHQDLFDFWHDKIKNVVQQMQDNNKNQDNVSDQQPRIVGLAPSQGQLSKDGTFNSFKINTATPVPPNWFSGSYVSGGAKAISQTLVSNSNSVFPVAGFQIADTVAALKAKQSADQTYDRLIGVDTDTGQLFGGKVILTSALKRLDLSTRDVMHGVQGETVGNPNNTFLGHILNSGDSKHYSWNGISPTDGKGGAVTPELVNIIEGADPQDPNSQPFKQKEVIATIEELVNIFNNHAIAGSDPNSWLQNTNLTSELSKNWGEYLLEHITTTP